MAIDFLSILIDRVGSTNVFNTIQGRMPSRDTHLRSEVDEDLIVEFLSEIERLSQISNTIHDTTATLPIDIPRELRGIAETFFQQFFPEPIADRLRSAERGYLFLHVDGNLRSIPWELLHDGTCFLADKFYIGKNISGYWREMSRPARDRLRVLIVADPTEDLEWARLEGEGLFESLNAEVSSDRLDLHYLTGRRITKLNLLNALKDRDIIHFAGHLHYDRLEQESGWRLSGGKIIRAREIEKAGLRPDLVFSNSCISSPLHHGEQGSRFNDLAGAFLRAGICNYIGTNWEIKDSQNTFDFAIHFYRAIFEEKSVGEALFEARQHSRRTFPPFDLTWANYVLHGNPMARIFRWGNRRTFDASRNVLNARRVVSSFPTPIARDYARFLQLNEEGGSESRELLELLLDCFEKLIFIISATIYGNYQLLSVRSAIQVPPPSSQLSDWCDHIYECLSQLGNLRMELACQALVEPLHLHRETIQKLLGWQVKYRNKTIEFDMIDSYLVTFQFLFENLLTDLASLGRYRLLYLNRDGETSLQLQGEHPYNIRLVPAELKEPLLKESIEKNSGTLSFFNSSRRILYSLDNTLSFDAKSREVIFPQLKHQLIYQLEEG